VCDFVLVVFEPPFEEIFKEKGAKVADVGIVIDCWATGIDFDFSGGLGSEFLFCAC